MMTTLKTLWLRCRFKLNGLLLLAPIWFLYQSLNPVVVTPWAEQPVGPFTATPTPSDIEAPYHHDGEWMKDFSVTFCDGCIARFRQAYISVGPQPAPPPPAYEGLLHGNGYRLHAHVPFPASLGVEDRFWITVEEWNGTRHHGEWLLDQSGVIEWREAKL
jgi:hypothetical protein